MSDAHQPPAGTTHKLGAVVRAVAIRLLVYGGAALAVAWCVAGSPFRWSQASRSTPQAEPPTSADPGWPHLRGRYYNGFSTNSELADSWPAKGPPVLWSCDVGRGYSGLIAVGNRVYTQAQTLTEQNVVALDANTGQTIWEHKYGWPYEPGGMYPGPRATPTWSHGRIYFAGPDGLVGCLRAADGEPLWSVNVIRKFEGSGCDFGYASSPVVEEGKVMVPVGGPAASVVALDAESGEPVWASGDAAASYCSVLPIVFQGKRQVVAFLKNALAGFDLGTGRVLWQKSYSIGYDEHAAAPLYEEPYLRAMQAFRAGSDLYRLEAAATKSNEQPVCQVKLVRHDPQMSNDVASSVLVDGHVYGFDVQGPQTNPYRSTRGVFRCLDFKSGATLWSSDRPGQATIAVARNKLLLFNDRGEVILLRANPQKYEELARTEVFRGEVCWTAPCLDRGRLYLRSPTKAACLYVGPPGELDRREQQRAVPTSELRKGRGLELTWLVGGERECPFELPDRSELARWYLCSMAVIAAAGLLAGGVLGAMWIGCRRFAHVGARACFWLGLIVLGIVATPMANRLSGQFVFTWPVSLVVVHQIALTAIFWARQPQRGSFAARCGGLGVAVLVAACLIYYDVTRRVGLAPAWYFLPTFLAAWPLAVPWAKRPLAHGSLLRDIIYMLLTFTLYFWVSGGLMLWRTAHNG